MKGRIDDQRIRNTHELIVERVHFRRKQIDRIDVSGNSADDDKVADFDDAFGYDEEPADDVADRRLRRKTDGKPRNTRSSEQGGELYAEAAEYIHAEHRVKNIF